MSDRRYRAVYIDAAGLDVKRKTFRYDVELHESFPYIIPQAAVKLVIDAPDLTDVPAHIDGLFNTVVLDGDRVIVCDDLFTYTYEEPNPHRLAVAASRVADMGYPFAGPLVIIDPIE